MKLTNPTDGELNAAFAEKVVGMQPGEWLSIAQQPHEVRRNYIGPGYNYCRSMDAVLPWLKECPYQVEMLYCQTTCSWHCALTGRFLSKREYRSGPQETAPRACVIALLRAHGMEVEIS